MAFGWFSSKPARRMSADAAPHGSAVHRPQPEAVAPLPQPSQLPDTAAAPQWQELVRHLGEEVAVTLNQALDQIDGLQGMPGARLDLGRLREKIEKARQAGLAAQRLLRLRESPPTLARELVQLDELARAALTARQGWLTAHGTRVHPTLEATPVCSDTSLLYVLVDEIIQWAGSMAPRVDLLVETSPRSQRPGFKVTAHCSPAGLNESAWHGVRWHLWHQIVRSLGALPQLEMKQDHLRISVSFPPVTEEEAGTLVDESFESSSACAILHGTHALVWAADAAVGDEVAHALAGFAMGIVTATDAHTAHELVARRAPDAVVFDESVDPSEIELLRRQIQAACGNPGAFIEIHHDSRAADFRVSTIGSVSTGHVSLAGLRQSLAPALVFELCKAH